MDNVFPSSRNYPSFRCCSPRQEEPPFFSHFPSPFVDDISATQLPPPPPQQNHLIAYQNESNIFEYPNKALNTDTDLYSGSIANEPTPEIKPKKMKRSSGKKDRHSKIHTAHGLRGRRMRLSIHIARKFFDLQDTLGFDKASKTLDWLFSKSKKAIKELTQTLSSEMRKNQADSCTEEICESALFECESGLENITAKVNPREVSGVSMRENLMGAERKTRKSRKSGLNPNDPVARESREKARARARERTIEKMMKEKSRKCEWLELNPNTTNLDKQGLGLTSNPNNTNIEKLGSPNNLFEPPNSHGQDTNFPLEDQLTNTEIVPKSFISSFSEFSHQKSFAPSGRLDFSPKSLNILENKDSRNLRISPSSSMTPFTTIFEGQNPICVPVTAININIHSQHLQERSVQFP